jgi:hypothetical protein
MKRSQEREGKGRGGEGEGKGSKGREGWEEKVRDWPAHLFEPSAAYGFLP